MFEDGFIQIRFDPRKQKGGLFDVGTRNVAQTKKEVAEAISSYTKAGGEQLAQRIVKRMADILSPSNKNYNVGETGKASKNFEIKLGKSDFARGQVAVYVSEGNLTPNNKIIRAGIPPGVSRATSIKRLLQWAGRKHIALYDPRADLRAKYGPRTLRWTKSREQDPRHRDRPSMPFRRKLPKKSNPRGDQRTDYEIGVAAVAAIRSALNRDGTERATANWFRLRPSGSGRFDYPQEALNSTDYFTTGDFGKVYDFIEGAIVNYLREGGHKRIGQRYLRPSR